MGSTSSILQIITLFIPPVLTSLGSFALFYYSQNKYKGNIVRAIFAETEIEFEDKKIRNLLQIKYTVEVIKFIVHSAFIVIYLFMNYPSLQTLITISQNVIISSFASCLNVTNISSNASSLHTLNISSLTATQLIITVENVLVNYGYYYFIFFIILFSISRIIIFIIQIFIFRSKKKEDEKGGKWHYYLYIPFISSFPTTSDLRWGIIFYLSFNSYLYVTLYELDILGRCLGEILFFSLFAFALILAVYISFALARLFRIIITDEELNRLFRIIDRILQIIKLGKDKRKSDKNKHKDKYEEMYILDHMFESIDSVIFWNNPDKPRIRVRVGSAIYEGEVKEIGRNLVIVSTDKQSNVIESHIRWEKIDAVEFIEQTKRQSYMGKSYFM